MYTDITVRKRAEAAIREEGAAAQAAAQAMSRFVAIVSHEIRTPLSALLSGLTLLADSRLARTQQTLVDVCQQSGAVLFGPGG